MQLQLGIECTNCALCKTRKRIVYGFGPTPTDLMIVGSCPSELDENRGLPFSSSAGALLNEAFERGGIPLSKIYRTNLIKCKPVDIKKIYKYREPSEKEIKACEVSLQGEIFKVKPKFIMTLGASAFKYFTKQANLMRYHGSHLPSEKYGCEVFACYHPEHVLSQKGGESRDKFFADVKTFCNLVTNKVSDHNYVIVDSMPSAENVFTRLKEIDVIAVDIETTGLDFINDKILGISFSWKEYTGVYIPLLGLNGIEIWKPEEKQFIINILSSILKDKRCILHNAKFDLKFLALLGINITHFYDTMIAYYLLDENATHGLKDIVRRNFHDISNYETKLLPHLKNKGDSYSIIPTEVLGQYAVADADSTFRLFNVSKTKLEHENFAWLYENLMIPLSRILQQVETIGVKVNVSYMEELGKKWEIEREQISKALNTITGGINLNSPKQLDHYLFTTLKLKPVKKTKSGAHSTDAATLEVLASQHPMPSMLLKFKKLDKLISTYINGMTPLIDKIGRIHTNFNLTGTVTGRLSSSNPNLQNIPRQEETRKIFIPQEGCKFITCDYSQIELRIFACYTKDPDLVESFRREEDIHARVASEVLEIPLEQVSKEQRTMAKSINFGLIYGRGAKSVAAQIGRTEEEAETFIESYFKRYPEATKWMSRIKMLVKTQGFVDNMFGRRRRLPEIFSENFIEKSSAERQAMNSIIQSTASDCVNLAAIRVDTYLKEKNLKSRLVLLVHDELVYEVPDNEVDLMKVELKRLLEHVPHKDIIVPLTIDLEVQEVWG